MDISVRIGDREMMALLRRIEAKVGNMKPLMTRIGAFYERRVLENFKAESAPDGSAWKPLAQDTMMMGLGKNKGWKKNGGLSARGKQYIQGKRILRESGDLEGSIHFQADSNSVTIGSSGSIPYAAIHQLGGQAGRGRKVTIPAREYLAMNKGDGLELAETDRTWILEMIRDEITDWE
jgi:phage virion morphogenesis protein